MGNPAIDFTNRRLGRPRMLAIWLSQADVDDEMFAELVERHCKELPGAHPDKPFGPDTQVWKVGGKMFAAYTFDGRGLSVKCQDAPTAQLLVQQGRAESAPYLKRGGWVLFPWEQTEPDELRARLTESYIAVRQELSAEVRNSLPPLPSETQH